MRLNQQQLGHLGETIELLSRPLDLESVTAWRGAVLASAAQLFGASGRSRPSGYRGGASHVLHRPAQYLEDYVANQETNITTEVWKSLVNRWRLDRESDGQPTRGVHEQRDL